MLLPRRVHRSLRFARLFFRASWWAWRALGTRIGRQRRHEGFLSVFGPLSLIVLIAIWATMLSIAFGVIQWAIGGGTEHSLANSLYMSGVTFFTLGFGDVTPHTAMGKFTAVAEAGTGFGLLAVVIGYLPVLYQLFSRREAQIIRLDVRAGSPPTAATLLARYSEGQRLDAIDALLAEWELWAAELLESHQSYPMLAFYRSQQRDESWLAALTAMMDVSALVLTGFRGVNTFQARVTFGTTRLALMDIANLFSQAKLDDEIRARAGERLSGTEFERLQKRLSAAGLEFSETTSGSSPGGSAATASEDQQSAESRLAEFRAMYEPYALVLAEYLSLPLPRWVAPSNQLDNWQRSEGAHAVKRLVESVEAQPD